MPKIEQEATEVPRCRILPGDCVESLSALPAGCIDAVVTDPPYGLEFMGREWDKLGATVGGNERWVGADGRSIPSGRVSYGKMNKTAKIESTGKPTDGFAVQRAGRLPQMGGGQRVCYGDFSKGGSARFDGSPPLPNEGSGGQVMQEWHQAWAEVVLRVLKPGGYALIFGGSRTYHRLACAVEDAGFEIRDCIMWLYGSGFPKGRGCLKPAHEPILVCRKPGKVLPLGIDECRVGIEERFNEPAGNTGESPASLAPVNVTGYAGRPAVGRWPANVAHDGSEEVLEAFARFGESRSKQAEMDLPLAPGFSNLRPLNDGTEPGVNGVSVRGHTDEGTAARFYYCAKANAERDEFNKHPTLKPVALMEWLVKLVCPPDGLCLDPFAGSGTTAIACANVGRRFIGCEKDPDYLKIAETRIKVKEAQQAPVVGKKMGKVVGRIS